MTRNHGRHTAESKLQPLTAVGTMLLSVCPALRGAVQLPAARQAHTRALTQHPLLLRWLTGFQSAGSRGEAQDSLVVRGSKPTGSEAHERSGMRGMEEGPHTLARLLQGEGRSAPRLPAGSSLAPPPHARPPPTTTTHKQRNKSKPSYRSPAFPSSPAPHLPESNSTTMSAVYRLMPRPPARVDSRNTNFSLPSCTRNENGTAEGKRGGGGEGCRSRRVSLTTRSAAANHITLPPSHALTTASNCTIPPPHTHSSTLLYSSI